MNILTIRRLLLSLLLLAAPFAGQAGADLIPGDFDHDGDVDLRDVAEFSLCLPAPGAAGCAAADLNGDVDVDMTDFALFSLEFTGPLSEPAYCPSNQTNCSGTCVHTADDSANCGTCGNTCAAGLVCQNGSCVTCGAPLTYCGGTCVDTSYSNGHCGGCGIHCSLMETCVGSLCEPSQPCSECRGD